MALRRIVIVIGVMLTVIAPLLVAFAYAGVVGDFGTFHTQEGWETSRLPGITQFVFKSKDVFVVGLILYALILFWVWLYVAWKHRPHLFVGTLALVALSLHVSLVSLLTLLLAVWLPVVARIPCC